MSIELEGQRAPSTANILTDAFELPISHDVIIFDNTLRDGEQTPGIAFSLEDKLAIARALDAMGVPWANVGFPAVSAEEARTIRCIVDAGSNMKLAALSRLLPRDIDVTVESGVDMLALFIAGSDTHLHDKLRMTESEAIARIDQYVAYAKSSGRQIAFGIEDGSRTPLPRLLRMYQAAEAAGADFLVFVDTVGVLTPVSTYMVVRALSASLRSPIALHFHDDLGLAHANTLAGLQAGARMAQVTVNNLGERAGNASLAELVVTLRVKFGLTLGLDLGQLHTLSQLVHRITQTEPPPSQGVTGRWSFTHESGIHVAGLLANAETYQPYPPALIGRRHELVFGKHSGKRAVQYVAECEGVELSDRACVRLLERIKAASSQSPEPVDDALVRAWVRAEAER